MHFRGEIWIQYDTFEYIYAKTAVLYANSTSKTHTLQCFQWFVAFWGHSEAIRTPEFIVKYEEIDPEGSFWLVKYNVFSKIALKKGFGTLWGAQGRSGVLWGALGRSGTFWGALGRSGPLWGALERSGGALWAALGRSGALIVIFNDLLYNFWILTILYIIPAF